MTDTAAVPAKSAGYMGKVGDLLLDVARSKYIDVERGDEDRNIPDYTETANAGNAPAAATGGGLSVKTMALIGAGVLGLLLVAKRLL